MIEETAIVVAKEDEYVWLEANTRTACGHCSVSSVCGAGLLGTLFKRRSNILRLKNKLALEVGDVAVLGIPAQSLIRATFYAYLLPLIFMIAGGISASSLSSKQSHVIVSSLLGLALGFLLVRMISGRHNEDLTKVMLLRRTEKANIHPVQFYARGN